MSALRVVALLALLLLATEKAYCAQYEKRASNSKSTESEGTLLFSHFDVFVIREALKAQST
jgi:hypothetical protein